MVNMKPSSNFSCLLLIVAVSYIAEAYHVKSGTCKEINMTDPKCGRKPQKHGDGRKKRSSGSPADSYNSPDGTNTNVQQVIVGGSISKPNAWPWMVALIKDEKIICGASLISPNYVLSAAHCFEDDSRDPKKITLMVGDNTFKNGQVYNVKRILTHRHFDPDVYHNDIAIITVAEAVILNGNVVPVCLPSQGVQDKINPDNTDVIVAGWGVTEHGSDNFNKDLKEVGLKLLPLEECYKAYPGYELEGKNSIICAGSKQKNEDSCKGDSGGPVVSEMTNHAWVQVGIVSYGDEKCGELVKPAVYTKVSEYIEWIKESTKC